MTFHYCHLAALIESDTEMNVETAINSIAVALATGMYLPTTEKAICQKNPVQNFYFSHSHFV